jgi:hypothetical protein
MQFGASREGSVVYFHKRTEMWGAMRDWRQPSLSGIAG